MPTNKCNKQMLEIETIIKIKLKAKTLLGGGLAELERPMKQLPWQACTQSLSEYPKCYKEK